jgi:hypothetical protein
MGASGFLSSWESIARNWFLLRSASSKETRASTCCDAREDRVASCRRRDSSSVVKSPCSLSVTRIMPLVRPWRSSNRTPSRPRIGTCPSGSPHQRGRARICSSVKRIVSAEPSTSHVDAALLDEEGLSRWTVRHAGCSRDAADDELAVGVAMAGDPTRARVSSSAAAETARDMASRSVSRMIRSEAAASLLRPSRERFSSSSACWRWVTSRFDSRTRLMPSSPTTRRSRADTDTGRPSFVRCTRSPSQRPRSRIAASIAGQDPGASLLRS